MILPATKRKKLKPVHEQTSDSDIDDVWNDMERIMEQPTTKDSKLTTTVIIKLNLSHCYRKEDKK